MKTWNSSITELVHVVSGKAFLVTLVIGFEGLIWVLIALVPGLCILFTFKILSKDASLVMRKQAYCICENKGTDQLTAKLLSVFVVTTQIRLLVHSLFYLIPKFQASSHIQLLPGLCRTWPETLKTGFLTMRLKYIQLLSCRSI